MKVLFFRKMQILMNYKYYIYYMDDHNIKPFSTTLPNTKAYIKSYDGGT